MQLNNTENIKCPVTKEIVFWLRPIKKCHQADFNYIQFTESSNFHSKLHGNNIHEKVILSRHKNYFADFVSSSEI